MPCFTVTSETNHGRYKRRVDWNALSLVLFLLVLASMARGEERGRLATYKAFHSQFVDSREVDVWLPPGYDKDPALRYPVVYMQDGQNLFDPKTSYTGVAWGVDTAMTRLIDEGKIRPTIIVGIWNTPKRIAEFMPQQATSAKNTADIAGIPIITHDPIVSDNYLKFMVLELKPFVDATYRTLPGRADTFVMGSSMGGLISAYALSEYPEVFGGAACLSTHWPAADGAVVAYLKNHLPDPHTHKFYFDHGTETLDAGYGPYQEEMDAAMKAGGYDFGKNWVTKVYEGANHSERSWSKRVDVPLVFLLAK
ncbi:MAG: alpha/beta hydrolase [Terracidiphilus sp.]